MRKLQEEKKLRDGTFLIAYEGDDINRDHWHVAPDGTILSFKSENNYSYNRRQLRQNIRDVTGIDIDLRWHAGEDQRQYEQECAGNYSYLWAKVNECFSLAGSTTDWKNAREKFKAVQGELKGKKLKKEQRDALFSKINQAFDILGKRQTTERENYEQECSANYSRLEFRVREAENIAYSLDFKSARERINSIKQELFNAKPMKREQKDALVQRVFSALDKLNSRAKEDFERRDRERQMKQAEWQRKLKESIKKMEDARLNTQLSISKDRDFVKRQEMNLFSVRPGKREIEIKSSIRSRISDAEAKIRSKEQRVRELDEKIRDARKKLD